MTYEPELGQSVFGNKYEEHEVPDRVADYLADLAETILDRAGEDSSMPGYGAEFENDVFEMHPYSWDGCTCGQAREECKWFDEHPHKNDCFHMKWEAKNEMMRGVLNIGHKDYEKFWDKWAKDNGYQYGCHGIAVYCDCGQDEAYEEWLDKHPHDPKCREILPNFRIKATGWAIHWYKFIGRGMTTNQAHVDRKMWKGAIEACKDSLDRRKK